MSVCKKIWKANPTGDGICLENSRALIAPLEFDSLAFRQNNEVPEYELAAIHGSLAIPHQCYSL